MRRQLFVYFALWELERLSQNFINQSITEWRQRPQTVIQNNGDYIEHLFKYYRYILHLNQSNVINVANANLSVVTCDKFELGLFIFPR